MDTEPTRESAMTHCRHDTIRLARSLVLLLVATLPLAAQMSKEGPSARFYDNKAKSKFSFDFHGSKNAGPVKWTADSQEFVQNDYVILDGNVRVEYRDIVITADSLTYNFKTTDVTAEGNVVLDQGPRRLTAERIVFNLDSETGTLFHATGAFEGDLYFTGKTIEKIDRETFRLTDGMFTSCDLADPSWSFHIKRGTVTLDDYARLHDVSFHTKKVPAIWLPYIVWPTKQDRARGFLIPKPGYSNVFGSYLKTAYFIPFGDSADATIHADLFSKQYLGLGLDVRYTPSEATKGDLKAYAVRDPVAHNTEWKYAYKHTEDNLPGGFRGVIDVQDYSDLPFFQLFERDFNINTISNIYSSAYLTRNTPTFSLNIRTDRREQFLGGTNSEIFEQVPALQLNFYPTKVGRTPIYFSMESSASHLRTSSGADYYRTDLFPSLSLQLRTPPWFSIKPQISLRETDYTESLDPSTSHYVDQKLSRFYAQGVVDIVGPSFSRIFTKKIGSFGKFKHVVEPRIRYLYTTSVNNQDQIIRFDTVDSPFLPVVGQSIEYALVQRIMAKEDKPDATAREIMSFEVKQSISLSDPFVTTTNPDGTVTEQKFTPVSLALRVNPYRSFRIDGGASISNVTKRFQQANISASVSSKKTYLNLTWFATFKQPPTITTGSSQLRIATGMPIWKDRLRGDVQYNYDIEQSKVLEQRYLLGYYSSCYNIALELRDFQDFGAVALGQVPGGRTRDYLLTINLKNVGTFLDFRGSLNSFF